VRRRGALLGTFVLLTVMASAVVEAGGPRIRVEPTTFDFGRVLPHRTLRKEFRLRNLGDERLVIERISRSCRCTEAVAGELSLEPGASTRLRVKLETRKTSGRMEERVLLSSNDAETPLLEIRLQATVVADETR
jgi:hypothetical protein